MEAPIPVIKFKQTQQIIPGRHHTWYKILTRTTKGRMPLSLMTLGRLTIKLSANTLNIVLWHFFH